MLGGVKVPDRGKKVGDWALDYQHHGGDWLDKELAADMARLGDATAGRVMGDLARHRPPLPKADARRGNGPQIPRSRPSSSNPEGRAKAGGRRRSESPAPGDPDLLGAMANRLRQVEDISTARARALEKLKVQYEESQAELRRLRDVVKSRDLSGVQQMAEERDKWRSQVEQMSAFLASYGLVWVGDDPQNVAAARQGRQFDAAQCLKDVDAVTSEESKDPRRPGPVANGKVDIAAVRAGAERWNDAVAQGRAIVRGPNGVAQFGDSYIVKVVFVQEGITVDGSGLWRYESDIARGTLADIAEASLPEHVRTAHGENVTFEIQESTDLSFREYCKKHGQNRQQEFLQRLPASVISEGGDIRRPRGVIEEKLGIKQAPSVQMGPVARMDETIDLRGAGGLQATARCAAIAVRLPDRNRMVVRMRADAPISGLLAEIERELGTKDFVVRSHFPPHVFNDPTMSIDDANLTPNGAVFVTVK
mmetsp:Transcript_89325/g.239320  ORF Transcript_89325/g.239320 Transcript_89325/m.239320 type:complete len:478 (+) Transcript_89325:17-1450(+)